MLNPQTTAATREMLIFKDGSCRKCYLTIPLLTGEQGNLQTLAEMIAVVRADRTRPDIREFILNEIVGSVRGHDFDGELEACFRFARDRIVYRKDPVQCERVADFFSTLYALNSSGRPEGDCGIKSTFFATCAAALGHRPYFVVIKQTPNQPNFNHAYCAVAIGGKLKHYDPTPEDMPSGREVRSMQKFYVPIF